MYRYRYTCIPVYLYTMYSTSKAQSLRVNIPRHHDRCTVRTEYEHTGVPVTLLFLYMMLKFTYQSIRALLHCTLHPHDTSTLYLYCTSMSLQPCSRAEAQRHIPVGYTDGGTEYRCTDVLVYSYCMSRQNCFIIALARLTAKNNLKDTIHIRVDQSTRVTLYL